MRTIRLGRSGKEAIVDETLVIPPGSLLLSSHGYPKLLRYTSKKRPGGSYIYEEIYLHHVVMGRPPKGMEVDHIDGNKLDARRSNLRICTRGQNARNIGTRKGRFVGVHQITKLRADGRPRFVAQITHSGKCYSLGTFFCEKKAAEAYNIAATRLHGEFARLNDLS